MRLHKLLLFLITLGVSTSALAQQEATVRLIHNSPDAALDSVTVYEGLNGTEVTGIGFRGNQSVDVPVNGGTLPIGLAPASGSVTDTVGFTLEGLQADSTYVAVVNGILQANQNQYEDFEPLSLQVQRVPSGTGMNNVGVAVNHGSPDAPDVDINETGVDAGELVPGLSYGSVTNFLSLGVDNYQLEVTPAGADVPVVGRFDAPLSDLNAGGLDLVVFASGFLDTTNNNNGPEFGLFAAAPGVGVLPLEALTAQLQLVHNVPDPAADSVDVFINGDRAYEDVEFRNASPLETVPGAGEIEVAVAAPGADRSDALLTANVNLPQDTSVIGVINGLVNTGDFTVDEGLAIHTAGLRTSANMSGNTDVLIHHGSEDAGTVTIADTSEGQDLVSGVDYPAFSNYIPLTTQNYTLTVQKGGDNLASFDANLSDLNLGGESATVIASGLFMEANREAGEDFGLLAVLTDGTTRVLPQGESGLASAKAEIGLETYPNPVSDELRISFGQNKYDQARIDVVSMDGQVVNTKRTAPAGTHTISMDGLSNGTYVVRVAANGQTVGTKTIVKQ